MIAVGVALMVAQLGLLPVDLSRAWWTLLVIGIGVTQLGFARRPASIGSAVSTTLIGAWFLVAVTHWYGLDWHNSWPLVFVAVGAGMIARAIAAALLGPGAGGGGSQGMHRGVHLRVNLGSNHDGEPKGGVPNG
jgi:hypothetical protein